MPAAAEGGRCGLNNIECIKVAPRNNSATACRKAVDDLASAGQTRSLGTLARTRTSFRQVHKVKIGVDLSSECKSKVGSSRRKEAA